MWKPAASAINAKPIISRNDSASMRVVGWRSINPETAPEAAYITPTASTISIAVSVTRLARIAGSVTQSRRGIVGSGDVGLAGDLLHHANQREIEVDQRERQRHRQRRAEIGEQSRQGKHSPRQRER